MAEPESSESTVAASTASTIARKPTPIPWESRRQLGPFRAYWRTVFWSLAGGPARTTDVPVDYRAAKSFRWMTIGHVMASIVFLWICLLRMSIDSAYARGRGFGDEHTIALILAGVVGLLQLPAYVATTGVVSWLFCPRRLKTEDQNRAIALSYYTSAPLAAMVVVIFAIGLAMVAGLFGTSGANTNAGDSFDSADSYFAAGLRARVRLPGNVVHFLAVFRWIVLAGHVYWWVLILFAARTVACRKAGGMIATAVLVPVLWTGLYLLVSCFLPLLPVMYLMMYASLA